MSALNSRISRRQLLKYFGLGSIGLLVAACQPKVVEKVVEKEVTKIVEVAPTPGPKLSLWAPKHFLERQNEWFTASCLLAAARNDFEVEVQLFPWGEFTQKQTAALEAGTLPDVLLGVDVPYHHYMDVLEDVSDLVEEIGATGGGFYEGRVEGVTIQGKQWGVPFHAEPQLAYFRKDIFEEAGFELPLKDLDEFVEATKAVTNPSKGIYGYGNSFADCPDGNNALNEFMWRFGGSYQDEEGNIVIDSEENVAAFTFYCELFTKHKVMPPGVETWLDPDNNRSYLAGETASVYNTMSIVNSMREQDPEKLENTVVYPMPPGPADGFHSFVGGSTFGIIKPCKHYEQCAHLIRGTLSPERYPGNLETAGGFMFPVLKTYAETPFFKEDKWNQMASKALEVERPTYWPGQPVPWMRALSFPYSRVVTAPVALKGADIREALAALKKEMEDAKAQFPPKW